MFLLHRIKNLFLTPVIEWEAIKFEEISVSDLFRKYIFMMAAIPAVFGFIGFSIFGISYGFGTFQIPIIPRVIWTFTTFILSLLNVYLLAIIIDSFGKSFGLVKNINASLKVAAFSYTPIWIAGIASVFPKFAVLKLVAGIYGYVLLYLGLRSLKDVVQDRVISYYVIITIVSIIMFAVFGSIAGSIISDVSKY